MTRGDPATSDTRYVSAAQAGDPRALDTLVMAYLPFVYTVVRRALDGDPDVDDVVQETMLRALRQLPTLRRPESFRAWLAVIAVRQVGTHLQQRRALAEQETALEDTTDVPAAGGDPQDLAVLSYAVSVQRRQVARASRWLDPDDRAVLSLWWLETAGELTRTEAAAAMGVSVAHAGVRLQRMRGQLELARGLVAALDARPRCGRLAAAAQDWDGRPSPTWRKRLARHVRSCARCTRTAVGLVPTERLLSAPALLAAPASLHGALLGATVAGGAGGTAAALSTSAGLSTAAGGTSAGVKAGLVGKLLQAFVVHPLAAAIAAGALVTGATVTTLTWPSYTPVPSPLVAVPAPSPSAPRSSRAVAPTPVPTKAARPPAAVPSSAAPAPTLAVGGHVSLESADAAGTFVTITVDDLGVLVALSPASAAAARQGATFDVVAGLADPACFSFRAPDGRYLRHASWRLRLNPVEGTALYRGDATFCPRAAGTTGSIWLESSNYPSYFLHRRGDELWVDQSDGSAAFRADSSFTVRAPLAG